MSSDTTLRGSCDQLSKYHGEAKWVTVSIDGWATLTSGARNKDGLGQKGENNKQSFEPSKNLPGTRHIKASLKQVGLSVQGSWKKSLAEKDLKEKKNQGGKETGTNE